MRTGLALAQCSAWEPWISLPSPRGSQGRLRLQEALPSYAESEDSKIFSRRPSLLCRRVSWKGCGTEELRLPPPGREPSEGSIFWTWMWSTWA